ncbi:hypothetical protein EXIGLDRAFT_731151, partial [Exidia glandulosa HHB12029]
MRTGLFKIATLGGLEAGRQCPLGALSQAPFIPSGLFRSPIESSTDFTLFGRLSSGSNPSSCVR